MKQSALSKDVKTWVNGSAERFDFLVKTAPIGRSTLRLTIGGTYNPGERLEKALRGAMQAYVHTEQSKAAV